MNLLLTAIKYTSLILVYFVCLPAICQVSLPKEKVMCFIDYMVSASHHTPVVLQHSQKQQLEKTYKS